MLIDSWLPIGFETPYGDRLRLAVREGLSWQIYAHQGEGRSLVAESNLAERWLESGLLEPSDIMPFEYGPKRLYVLRSGQDHRLTPSMGACGPETVPEAQAFAVAIRATRAIDPETPLHDGVYVERLSLLLPAYSDTHPHPDAVIFGAWLSGGVPVSAESFRRMKALVGWMDDDVLQHVIEEAGFVIREAVRRNTRGAVCPQPQDKAPGSNPLTNETGVDADDAESETPTVEQFRLRGRPELEEFFNEHVIEIIENSERYRALGIDFPSAMILHGPPGCGKTFAVERLVDYLGWPLFSIEASTVASPYIHDTSKKVAQVFEQAMDNAPSILIIDEMEAFLSDRQAASGHHHVEEVAEFLRRIPEAVANQVLIIAMTNRLEMIDQAIVRRGRFDHVVEVGPATETEIHDLLESLLEKLPHSSDIDLRNLSRLLAGRPLSDVSFIVREGSRMAARSGATTVGQEHLMTALEKTPARNGGDDAPQKVIGFR